MARWSKPPEFCARCGKTTAQCGRCRCSLQYCQHHPCPLCGFPLEHAEHHPEGKPTAQEWESKANSARCKVEAGREAELTDVERQALRRYPEPARLTAVGYRRPDGTRPPWATQ